MIKSPLCQSLSKFLESLVCRLLSLFSCWILMRSAILRTWSSVDSVYRNTNCSSEMTCQFSSFFFCLLGMILPLFRRIGGAGWVGSSFVVSETNSFETWRQLFSRQQESILIEVLLCRIVLLTIFNKADTNSVSWKFFEHDFLFRPILLRGIAGFGPSVHDVFPNVSIIVVDAVLLKLSLQCVAPLLVDNPVVTVDGLYWLPLRF